MREDLGLVQQEPLSNPNVKWEWIKHKARSFTINYGIQRAREQRATEKQLQDRLSLLLSVLPDAASKVQSIKRELSEILQHKANRAIFKSRANWAQFGEKPTAYFLGLEKRKLKENTISSIKDENGTLLTSNADILVFEKRYFENIYKEDPNALHTLEDLPISPDDTPKISQMHKLLINRPFTKEEFHTALKDLNKNRSPGSDGLTREFLLTFWDILESPFFDSIKEIRCFRVGNSIDPR